MSRINEGSSLRCDALDRIRWQRGANLFQVEVVMGRHGKFADSQPEQTAIYAIVLSGSSSSATNLWNSAALRLRGCLIRFVAPLMTTSEQISLHGSIEYYLVFSCANASFTRGASGESGASFK